MQAAQRSTERAGFMQRFFGYLERHDRVCGAAEILSRRSGLVQRQCDILATKVYRSRSAVRQVTHVRAVTDSARTELQDDTVDGENDGRLSHGTLDHGRVVDLPFVHGRRSELSPNIANASPILTEPDNFQHAPLLPRQRSADISRFFVVLGVLGGRPAADGS